MKKSSLIALALAAALVLGGGGVFAAGQIARSNAISEENARSFAYVDAGILPEQAEYVRTQFDFSKGRFVYEIEFIAQGMHYEYTLDSVTGAVIEREKEAVQAYSARHTETAPAQTLSQPESDALQETYKQAENQGRRATAAQTETKEWRETLPQQPAAETTIPAVTVPGSAATVPAPVAPVATVPAPTAGAPKVSPSPTTPAAAASSPAYQPPAPPVLQPQQPSVPATTAAQSPATQPPVTQPVVTQPAAAQPQLIGVEGAKSIALKDAGQTAGTVVFTKAQQEKDNGKLIYDIEFFVNGQLEYEYEIDAYSGAILEKDTEPTEAMKAAQRAAEEAARQAAAKASEEAARKAAEESRRAAEEAARQAAAKASEEAARQEAAKASEEATKRASEEARKKAEAESKAAEAARKAAEASRQAAAATQAQTISVDEAKAIALKDAGVSASVVQFEKAKLERDDGRLVYEIEFFIRGQKEYDYEIDAYTGRILEKDIENWDD